MTSFKTAGALAALALLASCASRLSTSEWQTAINDMKRDPVTREEFSKSCNKGTFTDDQRASMSIIMRVPESEVLPVFCRRLIWAIINDQVTAQQVADMGTGKSMTAITRAIVPTE